jgi:plastocyanin
MTNTLRRFIVLTALWFGCAAPAIVAADPRPTQISIQNFTFSPAELEVARGTVVEWVNADAEPHLVTGTEANSPLRSPALDTDDHYAVTLDQPGRYRYFCSLHPQMVGTIVVK